MRACVPTRAREDRCRLGGPLQARPPRRVAGAPTARYPPRRPLCTFRRFASHTFPRGVTRDLHRPRRFGCGAPPPTFTQRARLLSSFLPQRLDALLRALIAERAGVVHACTAPRWRAHAHGWWDAAGSRLPCSRDWALCGRLLAPRAGVARRLRIISRGSRARMRVGLGLAARVERCARQRAQSTLHGDS